MAVVALRLAIGWHFYKAGTDKLQSGTFNAGPFIASQAQGPFKKWFTWVLPNDDELFDLLLVEEGTDDHEPSEIDGLSEEDQAEFQEIYKTIDEGRQTDERYTTERTRRHWSGFLLEVSGYYGFGDEELEGTLKSRRTDTKKRRDEFNQQRLDLRKKVDDLRRKAAAKTELSADEQKQLDAAVAQYDEAYKSFRREERGYKEEERQVLQLRFQPLLADQIVDDWQERLEFFIANYRNELDEYFNARERYRSYQEDPSHVEWRVVEGRKAQMASIERELQSTRAPLQAQLVAVWEGLETDLNALAVSDQAFTETSLRDPLRIARPDLETSELKRINRVVPWFDTIVGALLILGLFTRPAALAGVTFLGSIMFMNPPWLSTSELTYYQGIEFFALLVLLVVGAGRYAGLDFFLRCLCCKCCKRCRTAATPSDVIQAQPVESEAADNPEISHESNA